RRDLLARNGEGHEEDFAFVARDAFSAKGDIANFKLNDGRFWHWKKKRLPSQNGSLSEKRRMSLPADVAASVTVTAFKTKLRRELIIAAMNPRDVALVRRHVSPLIRRKWEGHDFPNASTHAEEEPAD